MILWLVTQVDNSMSKELLQRDVWVESIGFLSKPGNSKSEASTKACFLAWGATKGKASERGHA